MSPRLVPLDAFLLGQMIEAERDPLTAEMCSGGGFARRALAHPGLAWAMLDGGMVAGCGGLVPMWPGRAEAWQLTSRHARPRHLAAGVRLARGWMDGRQRDPSFARIEAYVRADQGWALSFIAALGFVREGLLRCWDPRGRDAWLCARVQEGCQ